MTYAGERVICDADSHLMETRDWLHRYADPDVRPLLAPINEMAWTGEPFYHCDYYEKDWGPEKIADAEAHLLERKKWAALGGVDREERTRAMDMLGFERQFVFATWCWGQFDVTAYAPGHHSRDPKLLYGGARAHNRGVAEFCSGDQRLLASGMVPLADVDAAIAMADDLINDGCAGIIIPSSPTYIEKSWSHPDYDPIWARLSEARVPAVLHIGTGLFHLPSGVYNNGRKRANLISGHGEKGEGWVYQDVPFPDTSVQLFLSAMAVDEVFEKFPNLRVAVTEYGTSWVKDFLIQVDMQQMVCKMRLPEDYTAPRLASEYLKERVKWAPLAMDGSSVKNLLSIEGGERMLMFNSDYPHVEGGTDPLGIFDSAIESMTADLGGPMEEVQRLVYRDNFYECFASSCG